jgi:hypothetical protein
MARRVFVSYDERDRNRAKGFQHLGRDKNADIEFVDPHLLRPVDGANEEDVARKIKDQLKRSSVAVVLIGRHTSESDWVAKEVQWALEKDTPLLGIKIDPNVRVPQALLDGGAGIIEWDPKKIPDAIDRAIRQAKKVHVAPKATATQIRRALRIDADTQKRVRAVVGS